MKIVFAALFSLILGSSAYAQNPVKQSGSVTKGHAATWTAQGVLQDAGPVTGGNANVGIADLPVVGTGTPLCIYDAPKTNSLGYHTLCLGANDSNKGTITFNAGGGAAQIPLQICANGTCFDFPFTGSGAGNVIGPNTSTSGSLAFFGNAAGTLIGENRLPVSGYYYPATTSQALKVTTPSQDPAALFALEKTYDTNGSPAGSAVPRPTFYSACKLAAVGTDNENKSCRGVMGEGIDNIGGFGTFVEGGKFVGLGSASVPPGTGGVYGVIGWGQSVNSRYTIGIESQTVKTGGTDAPGPRGFNPAAGFVANFLASNGVGVGKRNDFGFLVNPYNVIKTSTGFGCGLNSIENTAGICFGDWGGGAIGLDLSLKSKINTYAVAPILLPNSGTVSWWHTDGTTVIPGIYLGGDNNLHLNKPSDLTTFTNVEGNLITGGSLTVGGGITVTNIAASGSGGVAVCVAPTGSLYQAPC